MVEDLVKARKELTGLVDGGFQNLFSFVTTVRGTFLLIVLPKLVMIKRSTLPSERYSPLSHRIVEGLSVCKMHFRLG